MKKRQFISAVLIYIFAISVLPVGFLMEEVKAAEISNNQTDYQVSDYYIYGEAAVEDFAILSKDDGIYTNKNGKMDKISRGKYTFGDFIGKNKEYAYFSSWNGPIEFNLNNGNYNILNLPVDERYSYTTGAIVDKQGNKWFSIFDESNVDKKECYLLKINAGSGKYEKLKVEGFNQRIYNLKCDVKNNIWFQSGDKNQIIGKINFDGTNNKLNLKTFELSSSKDLLTRFEVNKDGEIFIASYKDGRVWEILKYKEINGKMVFDKSIDSKTARFTADNNGELWFLTKGDTATSNYNVCKLESNGLSKKYDVSNLMQELSVYSDNNIILTGENLDNLDKGIVTYVYKVIGTSKVTNDNKVINNNKVGWALENRKWYYYENNVTVKSNWRKVNNLWYYFDNGGSMVTGWRVVGGKWYYLGDGAMKSGWASVGGKWYYLGDDGAMRTGWVLVSGKWYYLYGSGAMASSTTVSGYRLGSDGAWIR